MVYKTGRQLLVATLLVFLIQYKKVYGQNNLTGNFGEILNFWKPDPKFDSAARWRDGLHLINESEKIRYRSGNLIRLSPVVLVQHEDKPPEEMEAVSKAPELPLEPEKENKMFESETNDDFVLSTYEIIDQFNRILRDLPDTNFSSEILGRTASYNDIVLFKISKMSAEASRYYRTDDKKYIEDVPEKKIIFIVHALSSMGLKDMYSLTVERYLRKLLSFYFAHLEHFDIFLIPMANPDGYVQSKLSDFWNKNVSPQPACAGVAVDRNFDVAWNTSRQISSCSQQYPGAYPFSEPESVAVKNVFHQFSHKIIAYFHVHSSSYDAGTFKGDAVLYPRGFSEGQSDDDRYIDLRGEIDEAIKNANFKTLSVTVDTLFNWYGKVSGTSVDYAATVYGIPYAMELVMQIYKNPPSNKMVGPEEELQFHALTEIWGRLIEVLFTNIWKKSTTTETQL